MSEVITMKTIVFICLNIVAYFILNRIEDAIFEYEYDKITGVLPEFIQR